jgi:hypothetical protein
MPVPSTRADCWTWLSVIKEMLSGCTNVFMAVSALIDGCFDFEDDTGFGVSWTAVPWAAAVAGLIAVCSTYSHFNVNRLNQGHTKHRGETMSLIGVADPFSSIDDELAPKSTFCQSFLRFFYDPRLTMVQNVILFGDFLEHTCEFFGPINFFINLGIGHKHLQRVLSTVSVQLAGLFFAVPDKRVCAEHFLEANAQAYTLRYE